MIITRNFNALLIPTAVPIAILAGTTIEITQTKGSFATIYVNGNLARVESKDFDAIGMQVDVTNVGSNTKLPKLVSGSVDIELVWQALRTCYDPEIPVNIVDLGLIYDCCIIENKVIVSMTLTAPLCGMGPVLMSDVQNTLLEVANVTDVKVEMLFDPPCTTERMSESAKIELGLI
jgi:probable FeS assembly SUF system protein SufT